MASRAVVNKKHEHNKQRKENILQKLSSKFFLSLEELPQLKGLNGNILQRTAHISCTKQTTNIFWYCRVSEVSSLSTAAIEDDNLQEEIALKSLQ